MFIAAHLGHSFDELADRLDRDGAVTRWSDREPALLTVGTVTALRDALAVGSDPSRHDELLGAMLRLAAADSGDDQDAVLVVLHLVEHAASRLLRRFPADLILGQLTIQIRSYPWRTRTRACAANLLLDTEKGLCREIRPNWNRRRRSEEVPVDPTDRDDRTGLSVLDPTAEPESSDVLDLVDVLLWAERTDVVAGRDVAMLVEYYRGRALTGAGHEHVAAAFGVTTRTSKRRCTAALAALRAAAPDYLAA